MEFALEQAIERLPAYEPKRAETEQTLRNLRAGAAGERKVAEAIQSVAWPAHAVLLRNISLSLFGGSRFQMDLAFLSNSGILLLECKQIGGRLRCHSGPAELRKVDEEGRILAVYDCPVAQMQDQRQNLLQWLTMAGFRLPVYGVVVFANNPIIEEIKSGMPVFKLRETRNLIRHHIGQQPMINDRELNQIADAMISHSIPYLPFPLKIKDFIITPICFDCSSSLKRHSERSWKCIRCGRIEYKPYILTLLAWFLLLRNTITSAEIMRLFGLKTHKAARSVAEGLPLKKVGAGKASAYEADYKKLVSTSIVLDAVQTWLEHNRQTKDQYGSLKDHQPAAKDH